jgi:hypothetical protein
METLLKTEKKVVGNTWVYTTLVQVQTLEFTIQYNYLAQGRGGAAWKAKFNQGTFQESDRYRHLFSGLRPAEKEAKMKTMEMEFQEWTNLTKEKVTRRNRLLSMYQLVSVLILQQEKALLTHISLVQPCFWTPHGMSTGFATEPRTIAVYMR